MMTVDRYRSLKIALVAAGYADEMKWSVTVGPPATAEDFASEYVWVVLNSGIKNQVARVIYDRVFPAIEAGGSAGDVFGHVGKAAAIDLVWTMRHCFLARLRMAADVVAFCRSLPWIGPITCWHLAKNYGADVAKPDRWLKRVAAESGELVDSLCRRLSKATGDRVATVDLVIWRACNLGLYAPRRSRLPIQEYREVLVR